MYLQSYKELKVWQKSIDLVEEVYILTGKLPKEEIYCLTSQSRRAAISIPSNIAEGHRRKDLPEFIQFLRIADASSAELETQILILKRLYPKLNYLVVDKLLEEVQKMLNSMIKILDDKLKAKSLKLKADRGAAALPTILLIGGIVVEIGIALAFIIFFLGQSIFGAKASSDAMAAARAGVQDELIQIVRNKDYTNPLPGKTYSVGTKSTVEVTTIDDPISNKPHIISTGRSLAKNRRLEAIVDVNNFTGEVKIESIKEIPL